MNKKGFSLIELLVVVAIIGILAAVGIVAYSGYTVAAKQNGIKVFYYISPQIWAWKKSRIKQIKKLVDKMFVILPFEKDYYNSNNFEVDFVGHPLLDEIAKDNFSFSLQTNKPIIALLPGSRKQEISKILPQMLGVVNDFPDYQFIVATTNSIEEEFYKNIIANNNVLLAKNETYGLLANAKAALVTSGTATLETALFKVPEVVCYKGGRISYEIAKRVIKLDYISLVNLIMNKEVVKELIQSEFNTKSLKVALSNILDQEKRKALFSEYYKLEKKLGGTGASTKAAQLVVNSIPKNN